MDHSVSGEGREPTYLYHYTTVDTLAMILKTRTIRLRPLSKMDDLQECKTQDLASAGNYVFVSSWTDDDKESIPMWHMYSGMKSGIRVKMRANPFINGAQNDEYFAKYGVELFLPNGFYMIDGEHRPIGAISDGYIPTDIKPNKLLRKVEYYAGERIPQIIRMDENKAEFNLSILGSFKSDAWKFQNEWRYVFTILPFDGFRFDAYAQLAHTLDRLKDPYDRPNIEYFDFSIADDAFDGMEVVLSPEISIGNMEIVHLLKREFNKRMSIKNSILMNKIRIKQY